MCSFNLLALWQKPAAPADKFEVSFPTSSMPEKPIEKIIPPANKRLTLCESEFARRRALTILAQERQGTYRIGIFLELTSVDRSSLAQETSRAAVDQ